MVISHFSTAAARVMAFLIVAMPLTAEGRQIDLKLLLHIETPDPRATLSAATELLATGETADLHQAVDLFRMVANTSREESAAYVGMSRAHRMRLTDHDQHPELRNAAIAFAQKAVSVASDDAEAHLELALAYLRQHWFHLSLDHLRLAFDLEPSAQTAYWIGWMESEIGRLDEDILWLNRALEMDPELPDLAAEFGYAYRVLNYVDLAEQWLARALEEDRENAYARNNLVLLYLAHDRDDEAIRVAQPPLKTNNRELTAQASYGHAAWWAGDTEAALSALEQVVAEDPFLPVGTWGTHASNLLAELYWKAGRREDALDLFEKSAARYRERWNRTSEGWGFRYDMARIAAVVGEGQLAYKWLENAIDFGWNDYRLALRDPGFASLHGDERFQELMGHVSSRLDAMREKVVRGTD